MYIYIYINTPVLRILITAMIINNSLLPIPNCPFPIAHCLFSRSRRSLHRTRASRPSTARRSSKASWQDTQRTTLVEWCSMDPWKHICVHTADITYCTQYRMYHRKANSKYIFTICIYSLYIWKKIVYIYI